MKKIIHRSHNSKPLKNEDKKSVWWKYGIIYQIYPRSFYDSNGDGVGDIQGIIQKLDYLSELSIDAIWLSPVNTSPMYDFGYDILDYREIDPIFGNLNDFHQLIEGAHKKNIRIIMDMVMNHTSHLHPWFIESRKSANSPKRGWYIWADPGRNKRPPNNWRSAFGGSAWEWDEKSGQYYLHSFLKQQPDVNWRNEELKAAMFDIIKYWLNAGVDGFRLDVVNWFIKDRHLRNNPFSLIPHHFQKLRYDRNRKSVHKIFRELRTVMNSYPERMTVGEVFTMPPGDPSLSASYLGKGDDELHLAFDFSLMYRFWSARQIYKCISRWYSHIPERGWPCNVLSNHDQPRSITRFGGGNESKKRARVAAMLLLTLKGTPFIYYGEEIGMKNTKLKKKDIKDPVGRLYWPLYTGRDPARSPMQWSDETNAGFTKGDIWLPLCNDYKETNVRKESEDTYSLLNFYKRLIKLRKEHKALYMGSWEPVLKGYDGIIAYFRKFQDETIFIVLNFSNKRKKVQLHYRGQWKVLFSTHKFIHEHFIELSFKISPYEATMIKRLGDL
ncbi:MAG: alpha-glucosidase [Spirochaetes bacterium]|nr:alpha-glucosidase [Spirochaetota bacterium]